MIVAAILAFAGAVVVVILQLMGEGLPALPDSVMLSVRLMQGILETGAGIFWNYVYPEPVKVMMGFTIIAVSLYEGYKWGMWFAKKIPMFAVDD